MCVFWFAGIPQTKVAPQRPTNMPRKMKFRSSMPNYNLKILLDISNNFLTPLITSPCHFDMLRAHQIHKYLVYRHFTDENSSPTPREYDPMWKIASRCLLITSKYFLIFLTTSRYHFDMLRIHTICMIWFAGISQTKIAPQRPTNMPRDNFFVSNAYS